MNLIKIDYDEETKAFFNLQTARWETLTGFKNPFVTHFAFFDDYLAFSMKPTFINFAPYLLVFSGMTVLMGFVLKFLFWVGVAGIIISYITAWTYTDSFSYFGLLLGLRKHGLEKNVRRIKNKEKEEVIIHWLKRKY